MGNEVSKFEGIWKLEGCARSGKLYSFSYCFIDNEFTGIDNITGKTLFSGIFIFDQKTITFMIPSHNITWTQEYLLTDTYLFLEVDYGKNHRNGKFYKVNGVA